VGELEVAYDGGDVTVTSLRGEGSELDIAILPPNVAFVPTYVHQRCQVSFR
jgi:hypothetical protein